MDDSEQPASRTAASGHRLESWKEVAAHLKRGVSTVQRWEEQEGLPVHRHVHNKIGSVWADPAEIDAWWRERQGQRDPKPDAVAPAKVGPKAAAVGLVLLGGGILSALLFRSTPLAPPLLSVPLTSFVGREFDPSLSPDAKELAFVWDGGRGPDFALYVLRAGDDAPRRLTEATGVCCPAWSPDGRSIAFVRQSADGAAVAVMAAIGGGERTLTTLHPWLGTALAWSPDGKRIAYPDHPSHGDPYALVVLSLDTLAVRTVTRPGPGSLGDGFPSYSDDGKGLAFARVSASGDGFPGDVYVLRDRSVDPIRLTSQGGLIGGLDWVPGGREIVYSAVRAGENPRLWRVSALGGGTPSALEEPTPSETLAETASSVSHALRLSIARRTPKIAYVRRWYDTNIWSLENEAGSAPRRLIASTRPDESPQYSPDGGRIAFASTRSGSPEVWTCRRDGTGCHPLTHGGVHSGTPRWSPDGRRIAFDSRPAGQSDIYVIAVDSGETTRVTSSAADDVVPSWSGDGRFLYFASNRSGSWQVYRTSTEGGETLPVSAHGGFAAFEGEDAVYYTKRDEPGLWRVPKTGGAESRVLDGPRCWGHWALASEGVYLLDSKPGAGTTLDFFDFARARRTTLRSMDQTAPCAESSLAVAPGGRELLYVAVEESSDIMTAKIR